MQRDKAFRKHYRPFVEKEVNLLTYAEKEKIRFLHSQNPEEWTAENLANAFPISADGVQKIVKSTFRARSLREVQTHDQLVAERIQSIQSGDKPLAPDLEERMKMREQIPFHPGKVAAHDTKLLMKSQVPKIIGEFASLVTPKVPHNSQTTNNDVQGNSLPPVSAASLSTLKDPEEGDYFMLKKGEEAAHELRNMNISTEKPMTLSQFKQNLIDSQNKNSSSLILASNTNQEDVVRQSEEMEYIRSFRESEAKPSTFSDADIPTEESARKYEYEEFLNFHEITKYKPAVQKRLQNVTSVQADGSLIPETRQNSQYATGKVRIRILFITFKVSTRYIFTMIFQNRLYFCPVACACRSQTIQNK
jgi:hypothetical protein